MVKLVRYRAFKTSPNSIFSLFIGCEFNSNLGISFIWRNILQTRKKMKKLMSHHIKTFNRNNFEFNRNNFEFNRNNFEYLRNNFEYLRPLYFSAT